MSRSIQLPSPWRELASVLGGVGKLATALDVAPRTIDRWAAGERHPHKLVQACVNRFAKMHGVEESFR